MPVKNWIPLVILLLLLGVVFNIPWFIYFSITLGSLILLANYWHQHALDQVIYTRRIRFRRGFPGESSDLSLEVENRKLLPLSWLRITDTWPIPVSPEDQTILAPTHIPGIGALITLVSMRWRQRIRRTYRLLFRSRGLYELGPVRLESGDLFGIQQIEKVEPHHELLTVFPELLPLASLAVDTDDPFGDRRARRSLFVDTNQPIGVRPYAPEDDFRRIHWPATAHTGDLQVKVYAPVSTKTLMICLNVSTSPYHWLGTLPRTLEQLVRISATLAYHGVQDGYAVGLISNGCLAHSDQPFQVQPGRSSEQLAHLLSVLAAVTPYTSAPFEAYLMRSVPRTPIGSPLVVVTSLVLPALVETLVMLKRYRPHITLYSISPLPPPHIPGVRSLHLPFEE